MMARSIIESPIIQESPALNADPTPDDVVGSARRLIAALGGPALSPFLAAWPSTPVGSRAHPGTAAPLPVLEWLPSMARAASCVAGAAEAAEAAEAVGATAEVAAGVRAVATMVTTLARVADTLAWHQTYTEAQLGAEFLQNYGYTEIVGLNAPQRSTRIACGFLLLGPHTQYPRHRHEAQEIYVTLSGDAQWLQGDEIWRERRPGAVIQHASDEIHAMQTGANPLLAMYLWRSKNLDQKARLDATASQA
jgi:hypothetical protein